jgi:hypothetical protein
MAAETMQLFTQLHPDNLRQIAAFLDLETIQNLLEVFQTTNSNHTDRLLVESLLHMDQLREKSQLLLWTPQHFTRHLNLLSDASLAHVALLLSIFGDDNRKRTLTFMKYTFTEAEQPAWHYIQDLFQNEKSTNILYKELQDECLYRHYLLNVAI